MSEALPSPSPPFRSLHCGPCPGSCWGAGGQREMCSPWGTRGGLPSLHPHPVDRCPDSGPSHNPLQPPPSPLCPCPVHLPEAPALLFCQESGVGRELRGASGMSLSGASTSVPTLAEASGADGGSPDLVWNGEAGSHEPLGVGVGAACLPHLRWGTPCIRAALTTALLSLLTILPEVGELVP